MLSFRNPFSCLLALTVFTGFAAAQLPPVSKDNSNSSQRAKNQAEFVSVEGEFAIALPEQAVGSRSVEPLEGKTKGGRQFFWQVSEGYFTAGYVELYSAEDGKRVIETTTADSIEQVLSEGGKLISKKELSRQGNFALEVILRLPNAVIVIGRHFVVKKRIYTLTSGWKEGESGSEQIKILDSFKLIDAKAIIAKKIDEATPKPLPQIPAAKKLKVIIYLTQ
jgi:hypothetical protein